jgi:outer membrane receptor protein involved in Fe transport
MSMAGILIAGIVGLARAAFADSLDVYTLPDTVQVYGERIAKDPIRTPMATTDVPASEFRGSRQFSIDEAIDDVPGVLAQGRAGSTDVRITIRGFGAFFTVDNLSDENYVSSVFINGADGRYFEPGMERNYLFGLSIGGDFAK